MAHMICMFWWFIGAIESHNGALTAAITAFATAVMAVFTGKLVGVSRRQWQTLEWQATSLEKQATLLQAQMEPWIALTNWHCPDKKPKGDILKFTVDLDNPSNFPITLSGNLTVGDETKPFILSPNNPLTLAFEITVIGQWDVHPKVIEDFTYPDRITKKMKQRHRTGELDCVWWRSDRRWHFEFKENDTIDATVASS